MKLLAIDTTNEVDAGTTIEADSDEDIIMFDDQVVETSEIRNHYIFNRLFKTLLCSFSNVHSISLPSKTKRGRGVKGIMRVN